MNHHPIQLATMMQMAQTQNDKTEELLSRDEKIM